MTSDSFLSEDASIRANRHLLNAMEVFAGGDYGAAEAICNLAIQCDPAMAESYYVRGNCRYNRNELRPALEDFGRALASNPKVSRYFGAFGTTSERLGDYETAIESYKHSIILDPASYLSHLSLANLMASCPIDRFRNGELALEHAKSAFALSPLEDWRCFGSLAAAHAEIGHFRNAIEYAQHAFELAPESEKCERLSRVELYSSGQPYRREMGK